MATWNLLSTCKVTGVTTTAPAGLSQEFETVPVSMCFTNGAIARYDTDRKYTEAIGRIGAGTESNLMLQFAAGNTRIDGDFAD